MNAADNAYAVYFYATLATAIGLAVYIAVAKFRGEPLNIAGIGITVVVVAFASGMAFDFDSPLFGVLLGSGMAAPFAVTFPAAAAVFLRNKSAAHSAIAATLVAFALYGASWFAPHAFGIPGIRLLESNDVFAAIGIVLDAIITMGIPLLVLWVLAVPFIRALEQRQWAGLTVLAIPIAAAAAFEIGIHISDAIVLATSAKTLQADLAKACAGAVFAKPSIDQPFEMLTGDMADYSMGGFMDTPEYLLYDAHPAGDTAAEQRRIHKWLDPACDVTGARPMGGNYYFVNVGC